jgi:hypothetical protein
MKHSYKGIMLASTLMFSSCSSIGMKNPGLGSDFILSNIWVNSFSKIIYGYPDYPISRDMVENIPYASIRIKIGKGPAGLMILQEIDEDKLSWVSKDEVLIQTKNGRIIRTSNLNNDLTDYYYSNDINFEQIINRTVPFSTEMKHNSKAIQIVNLIKGMMPLSWKIPLKEGEYRTSRVISLSNPKARHIEVNVTTFKDQIEEVTILDYKYELIRVIEKIENTTINWKYENQYWVDPEDGFVWKSIQQIAPNVPPIVIEITKAPN